MIPREWTVIGELPSSHIDVMDLTESVIQVRTEGDQYIIDIGWYPEKNEKGCFRCRIIKAQDWLSPMRDEYYLTAGSVACWYREAVGIVKGRLT